MKTKLFILSFIIIIQFFLAGCWDYLEPEDLAHIIGMGIDFDQQKNEFSVCVQNIPNNKGSSTKGSDSSKPSSQSETMHTATDKTIYGAFSKLQQVVPKELFFGYLKVLILGENAAKYKMFDILELFDRVPSVRNSAYLLVASGKAEDTISTTDIGGNISSSQEIYSLIELSKNTGTSYPITIHDYFITSAYKGLSGVTPHVITTSNKNQRVEAKGGIYDGYKMDEDREGDQLLFGMAVFENNKLVGWLSDKESLGYNWITGHNIYSYKTSYIPGKSTTEEDTAYYKIYQSKAKIKIQLEGGQPIVNINVNVKSHLRKYYNHKGDAFIKPEDVKELENKLSDSIRSDMEAALQKAQKELNADIFGFGFTLYRNHPKLWRNKYESEWDKIYKNLPVNIKVSAKLSNTGVNTRGQAFK